MVNSLVLSPLAKRELEESHDWYEERLSGLGTRFMLKISDSLEVISINPEAFPQKTKLLRAMAIAEFPYLIIYQFVKKEKPYKCSSHFSHK